MFRASCEIELQIPSQPGSVTEHYGRKVCLVGCCASASVCWCRSCREHGNAIPEPARGSEGASATSCCAPSPFAAMRHMVTTNPRGRMRALCIFLSPGSRERAVKVGRSSGLLASSDTNTSHTHDRQSQRGSSTLQDSLYRTKSESFFSHYHCLVAYADLPLLM